MIQLTAVSFLQVIVRYLVGTNHCRVSELHDVSYLIGRTIVKVFKVLPEAASEDAKEVKVRNAEEICLQSHVIKQKEKKELTEAMIY